MLKTGELFAAEIAAQEDGGIPGFTIDCLTYRKRIDCDGAVLKFGPRSYARVLRVAEGFEFTDVVVRGDGWFLSHGVDGKVAVRRMMAGRTLSPNVYGNNMVTTYVAGKDGLEIHEISTPPFKPEVTEVEVEEGSPEGQALNSQFWQVYKFLRSL